MYKKQIKNEGQAMMIIVIFFVFISTAIISGLVAPSMKEFKIISENIKSKKSYFLAESGIEDAVYRIITNRTIGTSENLTIDSSSVNTNIVAVGNSEKEIISIGDTSNYKRKINLSLKSEYGTVFKYGSQAGKGGLTMGNNAGVFGSMYSSGDIVGKNGSFITGDAFVSEPPSSYINQSNEGLNPPPNEISFGKTSSYRDFAQSFQVNEVAKITDFKFFIKKTGVPPNAYVYIHTDNNGKPNTNPGYGPIAGGLIYSAGVKSYYDWIEVDPFEPNSFFLVPDVVYWLVMYCPSSSSSNYYTLAADQSYPNGYGIIGVLGGSWFNTVPSHLDMYFKLFSGGNHGIIDNVDVGENGIGDVNVYTLKDSTVEGSAYCKTGTGNNKSCNTSEDLPPEEDMPISDFMINSWKADAEAGGVVEGNLTITGNQSLGPKKINGNLTISGTLTLTNTVWVTGSITINGKVKLNPSYLATTGIIISDKYIYVANNSTFQDSGTAGSYIMLLSTSTCDAQAGGNPCGAYNAIEVKNNSNLIIANAQKGGISFQNNAGVKEVVANRIYLANNATVTYGSGLLSINFTSGPGGAWSIKQWKEVE